MTRTLKLTDTHLMLLSAASQRDDGLLDLASRLKGNTLQSTAEKLLKGRLVAEVSVDPDQPAWRSDEWESRIGLKITAIGLAAIGVSHDDEGSESENGTQPEEGRNPHQSDEPHQPRPERPGTKRALVISLLQREEGADLDDLIQATGWLPHTTRAALTGLRQRGYTIRKQKGAQGQTVYSIKDAEPTDPEGCANRDVAPLEAA
jgi:hypothetical protein